MKKVKRVKVLLLALLLTGMCSVDCFAAEESLSLEIIKDAVIGGLAGGLVGAAVLAATRKPGQHLEYLAYGAAGGVVAGGAVGFFRAQQSLVEINGDKVTFDVPLIMPDVEEKGSRGTSVKVVAHLVSGSF